MPLTVVAAVFEGTSPGEVLAFRRAPGEHHAGRWEFPGGKVEAGETLAEALRRELLEELGVVVTVGEPIWTGRNERLTITFHPVRLTSGEITLTVHDAVQSVLPAGSAALGWAPLDRAFCEHLAARADGVPWIR